MKKYIYFLLFVFTLGLQTAQAQLRDTVVVPFIIDGDPYGAINKFILGDTMPNGDRDNPLRIYELERNQIYYLSGTMYCDFELNLYAQPADDENKPPIIASGIGESGGVVIQYIDCLQNATFKNIYLQATPPNNVGGAQRIIHIVGDGHKYIFDNVSWEWGKWLSLWVEAEDIDITIRNCYFRNVADVSNQWNGRGLDTRDNHTAHVEMVNNTFFNINSFAFRGEFGLIDSFRFEHNTIVNSPKWPIQWRAPTNAVIKNNLFFNAHSFGETAEDIVGQDVDGLLFGIFNLEPLASEFGIEESSRKINFNNNNWFYSSEVTDYWSAMGLPTNPLFNTRTQAIFDDDAAYPNITADNTYNMNPVFTNLQGVENMIDWMTAKRNGTQLFYWGYDSDNNRFSVVWPRVEDLSYSNPTLLTGADDGLPVGDLNWFPAKLAEWKLENPYEDDWLVGLFTPTKENLNFSLAQNTPNPVTGETTIRYSVAVTSDVSFVVYDILGNKMGVLMDNKHHTSGDYTLTLDVNNDLGGKLSSGIYFYQMRVGNAAASRKMMVVK